MTLLGRRKAKDSKHLVTNKKDDTWQVLHSQLQDLFAGFAGDMLGEYDK